MALVIDAKTCTVKGHRQYMVGAGIEWGLCLDVSDKIFPLVASPAWHGAQHDGICQNDH